MQDLLLTVFLTVGAINLVHMGLYIGGANVYDMWQFRRSKHKPIRRHDVKSPLVTVIVPAHNEEKVIERCLDSIRTNTHRKIEVIVHNDNSTDATRKIVEAYKKQHPKLKLRLVNRRIRAGKGGGVNYCAQKYAKGDLVMTLDADCILHPRAIHNATQYFDNDKIVGVAANVRIMDSPTVLGLLQKFEHMIGYRSKKFYAITNSEFIIGGVASTYRREIMKEVGYYDTDTQTEDIGLSMKMIASGNRARRIIYADNVVASTEGVQTFRALMKQRYRWKLGMLQNLLKYKHLFGNPRRQYSKALTLYRVPMAFLSEFFLVLEPFILAYVVYLSIVYNTTGLFVGAYLTITLYVLWNIWPDEHSSVMRKIALSLYSPIMYFIFYLMDIVQVVAIFRCLIHPGDVLLRSKDKAKDISWTSPERAGNAVAASL